MIVLTETKLFERGFAMVATHIRENITNPRLVVGLDLDGTSGDFHTSFRQICIDEQGVDPERFPVVPTKYCYAEAGAFDSREEFKKALFRATGQGVYARMKPYEGFAEQIRSLYSQGAKIEVITSRPEDAMDSTLFWLDEVAKVPFHRVTITHEKLSVPADVYIDDMPEHIKNFTKAGKDSLIFDQPYNRGMYGERAHSWVEAGAKLHSLLR